ncbi:MAG TPA: hypothetical protein VI483_03370 [Candidatus Paceibacterota bacterium]
METVSATLAWQAGRPAGGDAYFAIGTIYGDNNPDAVPASGSIVLSSDTLATFDYVYSGNYYYGSTEPSGTFWCTAHLNVNICPNILSEAPFNPQAYQLPYDNNRKVNKNTAPICVTNTSGNNYFVPASTSIEIESFKTNLPPGATYEVLP